MDHNYKSRHDELAPYWAVGLIVLMTTGLMSIWIDLGSFWRGYVLDMTGPAWSYILFRGLFTYRADNAWTRFFTPERTLVIFLFACFGFEGAQYLGLYESTYDPLDFLAYVSILLPIYILDSRQYKHDN